MGVRLLLTNDDGIAAPGLWALARALRGLGEIDIVAPDREQSGVGASFTLHHPLRIRRLPTRGVRAYAVDGTPADAVILGLEHLLKGVRVDAVISGINHGTNLGSDVFLSGTVGAALHGHFRDIPSIAISMPLRKRVKYRTAGEVARALVPVVTSDPLFRKILLNVTVPNVPINTVRGVDITRLRSGTSKFEVKPGTDGRRDYYWIGVVRAHRLKKADVLEGTDLWALREKRVSITPLQPELTAYGAAEGMTGLREAVRRALGLTES